MITQTHVFASGRSGYHTYRIPALVVLPSGRALLFCEGRRHGPGDQGEINLLLARSDDEGRTWSPPTVVHEEGRGAAVTIGNPCAIVDARTGAVHLLWTRNNASLHYTRSDDGGGTWLPPRAIPEALAGFGYTVVRLGAGPGHGLEHSTGRLIAPIWVSSSRLEEKRRDYRAGVIFSDDGGRNWRSGGLAAGPGLDQLNECVAAERADGSLLLNIRTHPAGCRAVAMSVDRGATWSAPEPVAGLPCPTCQASLLALGPGRMIFANPVGAPEQPGKERRNLGVRFSDDDGATWSSARSLHAGPAGYSDLARCPGGAILCAFESGASAFHERISVARFTPEWLRQED